MEFQQYLLQLSKHILSPSTTSAASKHILFLSEPVQYSVFQQSMIQGKVTYSRLKYSYFYLFF